MESKREGEMLIKQASRVISVRIWHSQAVSFGFYPKSNTKLCRLLPGEVDKQILQAWTTDQGG